MFSVKHLVLIPRIGDISKDLNLSKAFLSMVVLNDFQRLNIPSGGS